MPPFDKTDAKIAAMLTDGGPIKAGSSKTILVKGTDCETRCISIQYSLSKNWTKISRENNWYQPYIILSHQQGREVALCVVRNNLTLTT